MGESATDGDAPRRSARLLTLPLDPLGLAELQNYINELRNEIARAEDAITRKLGHRDAADSVFRRP